MFLSNKIKNNFSVKNFDAVKVFLFVSVTIYLIFGNYHLGKFFTVDEKNWISERIVQYWQAVKHQEWKKTMINDKPGITLAYVSGIGLFKELHPDLYFWKEEKHISEYNSEKMEWLLKVFRLPILIFNGIMSLYLFWIIKKYSGNKWLALWSTIFIIFSPILLGISQIVNPDSLLWVFAASAIFSFLAYLKCSENKLVFLSGLFLGLSILTKYTAVILMPFFFILVIYQYFCEFELWKKEKKIEKRLIYLFSAYFSIIIFALVMFSFFMPAVITNKIFFEQKSIVSLISQLKIIFLAILSSFLFLFLEAILLKNRLVEAFLKLIKKSAKNWIKIIYLILVIIFVFILINWIANQSLINLEKIPFDARRDINFLNLPYYQKVILEFYPVVFSLSPLVLFLLLYVWIKSIFKELKYNSSVFIISVFILIYYIAVIKNNLLATIRYSIIIYPLLFFIAAVGLSDLLQTLKKYNFFSKLNNPLVTIFLIIACTTSLFAISPFYFNYANFLLPKKYLITGSWGEGGYEAAQYLNSLPNAENLNIWADYAGVCEFFKGKCLRVYEYDWNKYKIDYYVLTRRGEILYGPDRPRWKNSLLVDAYKYYNKKNPDWSLYIGDRPGNYIKIFKSEK